MRGPCGGVFPIGGEYSFATNCTNFHELLRHFRVICEIRGNFSQLFEHFAPGLKYTPLVIFVYTSVTRRV